MCVLAWMKKYREAAQVILVWSSWISWSALTYSFLLSRGLAFRNSLVQGSSRFHKQCGKKALLLTVAVPARDWWVRVIQNGFELAKTYIVGLTPRPLCQAKEPWRVFWECDCIARPDQCHGGTFYIILKLFYSFGRRDPLDIASPAGISSWWTPGPSGVHSGS